MSSSAESKQTKESTELKQTKEVKKTKELPRYKYQKLKNKDALRLLRLIPAEDRQEDIDCEIIEIDLPKKGQNTGDALKDPKEEPREDPKEEQKKDPKGKSKEDLTEGPRDETRNEQNGTTNGEPQSPDQIRQAIRSSLMSMLEDYDGDDDEKSTSSESEDEKEEPTPEKEVKVKEDNKNISYEAVSWCWGREPHDQILRVHDNTKVFAFPISKNLKMALWALRTNDEVRQLWVDAICINQGDTEERNQQVPRMDRIYGGAQNVCIWLGEEGEESKLAMEFIRDRVLELWKFDELIENRTLAKHWAALIRLMKRPWFSRRWVVQEIALSPRGGTIYCGKDSNSWQDFADAVSLFVEVESATHRLSDVMKLDQSFGNIPNFFGDVFSLGAALLVDATSNLFRNAMTGERKPLSSLEYLVSRLSVFEATQPRDTIYALLAISRETTPKNLDKDSDNNLTQKEKFALALAPKGGFADKGYNVDYRLPVIDVYKEFIEFSIGKADKKRALDILCRAWAPTVMKSHDDPDFLKPAREKINKSDKGKWKKRQQSEKHEEAEGQNDEEEEQKDQEIPLPSWIPGLSGAAFEMEEHPTAGLRMERQNADPLVGLPDESGRRNYTAAGDTQLDLEKLEFRKWDSLRKPNSTYPEYSMFVRGFVLDEVATVEHLAARGNIPYRWLPAGGWHDTNEYPPEEFWRTLVADRAQNGNNPPTYFPRACKESMRYKAKTMSKTGGYVDCRKLIDEGRCSIVAQFLRRVQEVIWNRQLMRTKGGRLGLVRDDVRPGFKVCILYGCSVPVILQKIDKTPAELKAELIDRYNLWYNKVKMLVAVCELRYSKQKAKEEREQVEKSRESRELQRRLSNMSGHHRRRKEATWPRTFVEAEPAKTSAPVERRKSSLNSIPEGSQIIEGNGAGPSSIAAAIVPEPVGKRIIPDKTTSPTPENGKVTEEEPHAPSVSDPPPENRGSDVSLNGKSSANQGDQKPLDENKKPKFRRELTHEERQVQLEIGKKLFEARKRVEKERVAGEVLKNMSYYRLFGESYVHGMMNGEAIRLQNEESLPKQEFELR
jgi:hypothetical protein